MELNILLVDDSAVVRSIIEKALRLSGVPVRSVHGAAHGVEALNILNEHPVDLVFSDINMPEMNGVELITRMARDEQFCSVPVIVVSTDGSEQRMHELEACGVKAYVRKPFTPEQIRDVVQGVLKHESAI